MEQIDIYRGTRGIGILKGYSKLVKYIVENNIESIKKRIFENPGEINKFIFFDSYVTLASNLPFYGNISPLCIACIHSRSDESDNRDVIVKLLLENGANVNVAFENNKNLTPLNIIYSMIDNFVDIKVIKILLAYNAEFIGLSLYDINQFSYLKIENEIQKLRKEIFSELKKVKDEIMGKLLDIKDNSYVEDLDIDIENF